MKCQPNFEKQNLLFKLTNGFIHSTAILICLPAQLSACLFNCLCACQSNCLHDCLPAFLHPRLPALLPYCLTASLPSCLLDFLPFCLPAFLHVCLFWRKADRQTGVFRMTNEKIIMCFSNIFNELFYFSIETVSN